MRSTQAGSTGTCAGIISATLLFITVSPVAHEPQEQTHAPMKAASACTDMSSVRLPDVAITEAVPALPGGVIPSAGAPRHGQPVKIEVAHCRVSGVIGKHVGFAVWLPDAWNGRFFMGGGGGFVSSIQNQAALSLNLGYATAGTDTGHTSPDVFDSTWALGNLEGQLNFGHLAIHRTATVTKAIVRAYYGKDSAYSYFLGCSNGGRQALMEAQRYPEDFDGIVAAAPAISFTQWAATCINNSQATFPNPSVWSASVVTPENLTLLQSAILARCDMLDGVKDGVIDDPRACAFRVADLSACPEDRPGRHCLTRAQRATVQRIYTPSSQQNLPPRPFGGEDEPSSDGRAGSAVSVPGCTPRRRAAFQPCTGRSSNSSGTSSLTTPHGTTPGTPSRDGNATRNGLRHELAEAAFALPLTAWSTRPTSITSGEGRICSWRRSPACGVAGLPTSSTPSDSSMPPDNGR